MSKPAARSRRLTVMATVGVAAVLAFTATACEPPVYGDQDLEVTVDYVPERIGVGSNDGFRIYVHNRGTAPATNVKAVFAFPDSISPQASSGCSAPAPLGDSDLGYIVCNLSDLAPGATRQQFLTIDGLAVDEADLIVVASSDVSDHPDGAPHLATASISVVEPWLDLAPEPIGPLGTLTVGAPGTQTVGLKNHGPLTAPQFTYVATYSPNITVTDALLWGYVNGQFTTRACNISGQTVACVAPAGLGRYASGQFDLTASVTLTATSSGPTSATHEVTSAVGEVWDDHPNVVTQSGSAVDP